MNFDKILCIGWYDGATSGLVLCSDPKEAFRFDLIAWDGAQKHRIFALSPLDATRFDEAVDLLRGNDSPTWPMWCPVFPPRVGSEAMYELLDAILKSAGAPKYIVGGDSLLETVYAIRQLSASESQMLPDELPDFFSGKFEHMDFKYWSRYLDMQSELCAGE